VAETERKTFQLTQYINSNADCCVCGKEVLVYNDFEREVAVTGWDPEGETRSLRILSEALG
jgi:hypothetical protein